MTSSEENQIANVNCNTQIEKTGNNFLHTNNSFAEKNITIPTPSNNSIVLNNLSYILNNCIM